MVYRELNLSDMHVPYHDPHAWQLVLRIVAHVEPAAVNIGGDLVDFYRLSNFDKDPDRYASGKLQVELDLAYAMLQQLRQAVSPFCTMRFVPGNHEYRLTRYLMRHTELHGLRALDLVSLLRLDELGIDYFEHEIEIVPDQLILKHGSMVRKDSAMTARAELDRERYAISLIHGHTHRLGAYYATTRNGMVAAYENGCLCSLTPEFVHRPNWQLGCTMTTHLGGDLFHVDSIPFLNQGTRMKALVLGKVITIA